MPTLTPTPPRDARASLREELPAPPTSWRAASFDFVLDLGQDAYLFSRDRVERWSAESGGARFLVCCADYGPGASMGATNAQGSLKFAEILVRKRLEERGELTPDKQLLVYEKRKTLSGEIRVVYQIADKARVSRAVRSLAAQPSGALLFDALSLLRGLLRGRPCSRSGSRVRGLALALDDSVALVVGEGKELLFARRYPRLAQDEHSLAQCLALARQDLATLSTGRPGLDEVLWIEPLRVRPMSQAERTALREGPGPEFLVAPLVELRMGHGRCWSALPPLLPGLSFSACVAGRSERWLRPLERWEPALWLGLAAGILLLLALAWGWAQQGRATRAETERLRAELTAAEANAPPALAPLDTARMEETFRLTELLRRASDAPPLSAVWSALAEARPPGLELMRLSLDYPESSGDLAPVEVALVTRATEGLLGAQTLAGEFVGRLERQGFTILERSLALDNERENLFSLRLRYARTGRP